MKKYVPNVIKHEKSICAMASYVIGCLCIVGGLVLAFTLSREEYGFSYSINHEVFLLYLALGIVAAILFIAIGKIILILDDIKYTEYIETDVEQKE